MPDREPRRPGLTKDARAGQRPAQAAAQDPRQGDRRRGAADRPLRRSRGARRGRPQEPQYPVSGWRYEQFGKDALDLVEGRLAFAIENGKLKMSRVVEQRRRSMRRIALLAPARCSPPAPTAPRRNRRFMARRRATSATTTGTDQFIGQPATSETGAAILRRRTPRCCAGRRPASMLTMDFSADRVTV